ncbi:hypothetical protein [Streptomyces sp. AD55]|uniref:hypothetical protein n=1 Tax=Streptomyces sp. AD55 TaxID=3242895 RepID=UPI0035293E95
MREKPDSGQEADIRAEGESRRIELSVPQVAGSALAAVLAAKLASSFGVYGTILGAGVISVVATCGGPVFQHFFRSTGERLRAGRPVTPDVTARTATGPAALGTPPAYGEYTEGTLHRARVKSWKRPLLAAAVVFGVTMGGVTAYELASGESLSGGANTTVGGALSGENRPAPDRKGPAGSDESPAPGDSATPGPREDPGTSGDPDPAPSAGPGTTAPDGGTETGRAPAPDASAEGDEPGGTGPTAPVPAPTDPAPSASGRSGTGDPDPAGPAAP